MGLGFECVLGGERNVVVGEGIVRGKVERFESF